MAVCLLDKCCFCVNLRTGCFIIAYLQLVGAVALVVQGIRELLRRGARAEGAAPEPAGVQLTTVLVLLLVAAPFTLLLLAGLHRRRRAHVGAYLIYAVIVIVLAIIFVIASFAGSITASYVTIIKTIIDILLNIYFVMVIRSYYYKMDEKRPAVYNTA